MRHFWLYLLPFLRPSPAHHQTDLFARTNLKFKALVLVWDDLLLSLAERLTALRRKIVFALASCLLAIMRDMVSEPMGSIVGDMQECLRIWKKVRLG